MFFHYVPTVYCYDKATLQVVLTTFPKWIEQQEISTLGKECSSCRTGKISSNEKHCKA